MRKVKPKKPIRESNEMMVSPGPIQAHHMTAPQSRSSTVIGPTSIYQAHKNGTVLLPITFMTQVARTIMPTLMIWRILTITKQITCTSTVKVNIHYKKWHLPNHLRSSTLTMMVIVMDFRRCATRGRSRDPGRNLIQSVTSCRHKFMLVILIQVLMQADLPVVLLTARCQRVSPVRIFPRASRISLS